ncbi:bifunctional helix-turn-helix transcriptional regulator/GNAT family N-acetyltransferase [Brevundimonas faecalis]|uniref:DNA-binding MarR family transcriptional regulator/GNAT superfamily N-acetyltransferase n=1 Tax=Brevundimonas faecalis TaxID=947378 RepID=A0ABV2R8D5_9CAUL
MIDDIARFRRFARAVTAEVGALDHSFLGRGRPLGAARVLNAVGQGRNELAQVRDYLRLDSGLASRLLRGLEDEDLVAVTPAAEDARRRRLSLTPAGEREFAAYEALSDERARTLLARFGDPQALLAAFDLIATALIGDRIEVRQEDPRSEAALWCLGRYYEELDASFPGGFAVEQSHDPAPQQMTPPLGAFLVAFSDGLPIGCVGVKGDGGETAEIKRLWVAPAARGAGLAGRLMTEAEAAARALSVVRLRLDTNRALPGAVRLYRRLGWTEIDRFNDDPYAEVFFERMLSPVSPP